uniref:Microtubule-associated protein 1B/S N-terminal domain-containing protein n=1 Tax=Geospiza parvula TaxID=87175 RepID=A0A8U8CLB9_GEOPR
CFFFFFSGAAPVPALTGSTKSFNSLIGTFEEALAELLRIRSWDIDLTCCNLDEQLKLFVSRHSATFSSIVKGGEGRGQGDFGAGAAV